MMDEEDEFSVGPENEVNPVEAAKCPTSRKRKHSVAFLPMKQERLEGAYLEASAKEEGEDAAMSHGAQEEQKDSGDLPAEGSLLRCDPAEVMHMEGARVPPMPLGSVSADLAGVSKAGLLLQAGGMVSGSDLSACDYRVTGKPAWAVAPTPFPMRPAETNADIKRQLIKEILKFERKYDTIFKLLEEVQGPVGVRKQFVEFTINEGTKFKLPDLVKQLEKILENIVAENLLNKDTQTSNI